MEAFVCEWNFYALYAVGYNTRMVIAESFCKIHILLFL